MRKDTILKKARDREKTQAVTWVSSKFNVEKAYVYGILRGDFNYGRADEIKKVFDEKYKELKAVMQ